jgi:hypothetical protein
MADVRVGGDAIRCTDNHPFWAVSGRDLAGRPVVSELPDGESKPTPAGRWVEARDLCEGDVVLTGAGRTARVQHVRFSTASLTVYNLTIAGLHNYAVGPAGVLVHSACPRKTDTPQPVQRTPRAVRRETMREAGITTSQQPSSQTSVRLPDGTPAGRQLTYLTPKPGGGTQTQSVRHSLIDAVPGHGPHWEAGPVKPGGQLDSLGRPRLTSDKVRLDE